MKFLVFIFIPFILFSETYFVDNYAPVAGNGSINNPFNSLKDVLSVVQPGDTVFIRGNHSEYGQLYFEDIDLPRPGNINKQIIVTAYKNEKVVIFISQQFIIDENYWIFNGITFENSDPQASEFIITGEFNSFSNCTFRTVTNNLFANAEQKNNHFQYCTIEY